MKAISDLSQEMDKGNGGIALCESLKKNTVLTLFTFLKGLEATKQDYIFSNNWTKDFCGELSRILENV